ncbi:uncharacterized protein VTP21DRAFT_966 [Calcarisporiella thermophila]|uniref:uncharacterized protein n=1 Tax=Calcarisporiella thermophila TaxID=911321 RepID=UPI003744819D
MPDARSFALHSASYMCQQPFFYSGRLSPCSLEAISIVPLLLYTCVAAFCYRRHSRESPRSPSAARLLSDDAEPLSHRRPQPFAKLESLATATALLTRLILLVTSAETLWMLGTSLGSASPTPLYLLLAPAARSLTWGLHLSRLRKERRDIATYPSASTLGFCFFAFLLSNLELYHFIVYLTHPASGDAEASAFALNWPVFLAFTVRYALLLALVACTGVLLWLRVRIAQSTGGGHAGVSSTARYGTFVSTDPPATQENGDLEQSAADPYTSPKMYSMSDDPKYKPPKTAGEFLTKFPKLFPFLWPHHDRGLQLRFLVCFVLLIGHRVVNVLVPIQQKFVIDALEEKRFAWHEILIFVFLRFMQGGVGLISTAEQFLWLPIGQFTTRQLQVKMFEHLLHLSLRFHLQRKTGEILRVQDRGVSSIVTILSSIFFNIIPTLMDVVVACMVMTWKLDFYFGAIVFITMTLYIFSTVVLTEWRTKYRREANLLDNNMEAKAVDSLINYETVKLYAAEKFEVQQYLNAVLDYQSAEWMSNFATAALKLTQNCIIQVGLLAGCLLVARRIVDGKMTVGDFALYMGYILQLYGPLNWFGTYYRQLQKNFVDMEKMLDLFQEPMEVKDLPQAAPCVVKRGEVKFENVSFSYDKRSPTLRNISFTVEPGATVALVGPSGSGKSTLIRLLFRFYDVNSGRILIDGQDIRHVRQGDLRKQIGIVPQDPVLFNDTLRYNIRYGRIDATDLEVEEAATAAHIHNQISSFPEGYATRVGERGMRLSGGEKQRVAIARTLLKNPPIVLLDEATSAMDSATERLIHRSLRRMTTNRTTLVIAHRLSTIVNADLILVLRNGEIVERGRHTELMQNQDGLYHDMWMKQLHDHDMMAILRATTQLQLREARGEGVEGDGCASEGSEFESGDSSSAEHTTLVSDRPRGRLTETSEGTGSVAVSEDDHGPLFHQDELLRLGGGVSETVSTVSSCNASVLLDEGNAEESRGGASSSKEDRAS